MHLFCKSSGFLDSSLPAAVRKFIYQMWILQPLAAKSTSDPRKGEALSNTFQIEPLSNTFQIEPLSNIFQI
jgi:hypothetical protein